MKNFLIYKSSAGSGKTYTLVKEYLKIVLKNPDDFKHALAVTFTNKAAEEMKNRIVEKLSELSSGSDEKLIQSLEKEIKGVDIRLQSTKVLENILHRYSYFSVFTIDSFFYRIIRSLARELKLYLSQDLELDQDNVLDRITDELLDKAGVDKQLTDYLENFIYYYIDEDRGWKIDKVIKNIGSEIFKERYWEKKSGLKKDLSDDRVSMKNLIGTLFAIVKKFESVIFNLSDEANRIVETLNLGISDFPLGTSGPMNYLLNKIKDKKFEPTSRVRDAYNDRSKLVPDIYRGKTVPKEIVRLQDVLVEIVDQYDKNFTAYNSAVQLTKTIYVSGIFNDLLKELKFFRDEKKTILISDMNNLLQNIISKEASPFVYEKTGSIYRHYLIDEFQDTSTFQWNNIYPLILNSLSENNFSMVVGDVKQSIYRWRNGNMKLLLEKIYDDLKGFKDSIGEEQLLENWRSGKEIVEFNNWFFQKAVDSLTGGLNNGGLIKKAYYDCVQKSVKGKEGGFVSISYFKYFPDDELTTYEKALHKLLEHINEIKQQYSLKDILILVRKNKEGAEIAKFLNINKIKVVSDESLLLTNSPKVKLLINLLKFIIDNKNTLARTEILYNYTLIQNVNEPFDKIFCDFNKFDNLLFHKILPSDFYRKLENGSIDYSRLNPVLNNLTLYELIEHLIIIFNLGINPDVYLQRFQDMILEYLKDNKADIESFLQWWEENQGEYSIILPEQEDAVRIMTIHSAKGLQSKVVIIPYANWNMDLNGGKDMIWVNDKEHYPFNQSSFIVKAVKDLNSTYFKDDYAEESILTNLDNLNLLYVAFTRASEQLYVIVPEKGDKKFYVTNVINEVVNTEYKSLTYSDESGFVYEKGTKNKQIEEKEEGKIKTHKISSYISTDWYRRIVIRPKHENLKLVKEKDFSDKTTKGVILHKTLSLIKKAEDVENAVNTMLSTGLIITDEIEEFKNTIEQFISNKEIKPWFSGKWLVKTESEILLPDGKILRPDRVMIQDKNAIVVDYKTGSHKKEHEHQLNEYATVLSKLGYDSVEKYIIYTDKPKIVKL